MDRFDRPASDSVARRLWRRYCPVCRVHSTAVLAPARGAYETLIKRLLRRQAVECLACGTRLPGYVSLGHRRRWMRTTSKGQSFMRPRDGRSPDQLLTDLRRAEHNRELGEALESPLRRRQRQQR